MHSSNIWESCSRALEIGCLLPEHLMKRGGEREWRERREGGSVSFQTRITCSQADETWAWEAKSECRRFWKGRKEGRWRLFFTVHTSVSSWPKIGVYLSYLCLWRSMAFRLISFPFYFLHCRLPFMTSEQKGGGRGRGVKKFPKFANKQFEDKKRRRGSEKSQNCVHVLYGSPPYT